MSVTASLCDVPVCHWTLPAAPVTPPPVSHCSSSVLIAAAPGIPSKSFSEVSRVLAWNFSDVWAAP
jgi:hypothetical protein